MGISVPSSRKIESALEEILGFHRNHTPLLYDKTSKSKTVTPNEYCATFSPRHRWVMKCAPTVYQCYTVADACLGFQVKTRRMFELCFFGLLATKIALAHAELLNKKHIVCVQPRRLAVTNARSSAVECTSASCPRCIMRNPLFFMKNESNCTLLSRLRFDNPSSHQFFPAFFSFLFILLSRGAVALYVGSLEVDLSVDLQYCYYYYYSYDPDIFCLRSYL